MNQIVDGQDTKYLMANRRTTVVRLMGDLSRDSSLIVLERDYQTLRKDEADRELWAEFLRAHLQDKVVLLLGYDPVSPDFNLLMTHVLNHHLAGCDVEVFCLWPEGGPPYAWSAHPLYYLKVDTLPFMQGLVMGA